MAPTSRSAARAEAHKAAARFAGRPAQPSPPMSAAMRRRGTSARGNARPVRQKAASQCRSCRQRAARVADRYIPGTPKTPRLTNLALEAGERLTASTLCSERTAEVGHHRFCLLGTLLACAFKRCFGSGVFGRLRPGLAHLIELRLERGALLRRDLGGHARLIFLEEVIACGDSNRLGLKAAAHNCGH